MKQVVFVDREVPLVVLCASCGWAPSPWSPDPRAMLGAVAEHWLAEHWAGRERETGEEAGR